MNIHQPIPRSSQRGFTLMELLIVISIIAVLASLSMPVYNSIMNRARAVQAKAAMAGIVAAIRGYETEYNRLPNVSLATGIDDGEPFETSAGNKLLPCLMAKDLALNPRQIPYYDPPASRGSSGFDAESGALNDPWGHPYFVALDGNGDNVIDNPYAEVDGGSSKTIPGRVIVYSYGTNGIGMDKDDVRSWR